MPEPLNNPVLRQADVKVSHRLGYWYGSKDMTQRMMDEADAQLEAHILWRIEQSKKDTGAR